VYDTSVDRTIGDRIREERTRLGWEQADLAQRLSTPVKQQTVSRWEQGGSRPRRDMVIALAQLFGVDPGEFLQAAGYLAPSGTASSVTKPVRPLMTILPVWELAPDKFEELVADLARVLRPDTHVSRFGSQGHKQYGVDVVAEKDSHFELTFQCKRREQFGRQNVKDAVAEVTIEASAHYLVLSRRSASPDARKEMQRHKGWTLWDAEDISRTIRGLPLEQAVRLVDTFFPGWRESSLGVAEPGPWLSVDEFFLDLSPSSTYNHHWTMVGRDEELSAIGAFIADPSQRVGLIVGRGGIGKTKLLREVAESQSASSLSIRFIKPAAEPRAEHYELLPIASPLLVVVDDAHDRDDVVSIIDSVVRRNSNATVLLGIRPYAIDLLASELRRVGLRLDDVFQVRLGDLSTMEAEQLAAQALGSELSGALAARLGALTADSPFITVIAGVLIQRGLLDPACIDHEESIRTEVLRTFHDLMVADSQSGEPELHRAVLDGIAVFQPFHSADPTFQNSLSGVIDQPYDRAVKHIRSFEDAGVLLRRGDSLRIVPDLLGDVVLSRACFDDRGHTPTGYLERALQSSEGEPVRGLFVNAARVGWQIRHDYPDAPSLTESLWDAADSAAQSAGILGRVSLLQLLRKIAYFEPERTLKLVRWIIDNPTDAVEEVDHPMARMYPYSYQDVLNEVPAVLQAIAYNMTHLRDAANILWDLAATDRRETNRYPEHPLRVLRAVAEIATWKPLFFNNAMIDIATEWFGSAEALDVLSPFDVLEVMLATEGTEQNADGFAIRIRSYTLAPSDVEALRDRVLELAFDELSSPDIARATRAVTVIESSLRGPIEMMGQDVSGIRDAWIPLFLKVLEQLRETLAGKPVDSVIGVAIRRALQWHLEYGDIGTADAARAVIESLPRSLDQRLAICLFDGWGELLEGRTTDLTQVDALKEAQADELVKELLSQLTDDEIVDRLQVRLTAQQTAFAGKVGTPGFFAWRLVSARSSVGALICNRVVADPDSELSGIVAVVLACLADEQSETEQAMSFARDLLATGYLAMRRSVAHALGWNRGARTTLLEGEMEILLDLARSEDVATRQMTVVAARRLAGPHRGEALSLICNIPFADSENVADEVFQLFTGMGSFRWDELPTGDAEELLEQLKVVPSIEEYWIQTFLSQLSATQPTVVIDLLKDRIDAWEGAESVLDYHPVPYVWHLPLQVLGHPDLTSALRGIQEWLEAGPPDSWKRQQAGGQLFAAVAQNFDHPDVMSFVEDTIANLRDEASVRAVSSILRNMPRDLFLTNPSLVSRVLEAAAKVSEDAVGEVGGAMHGAVTSGSYTGSPGQPFPRDVQQRDQARAIASTLAPGSWTERFYRSLEKSAEERIRWQAERDQKFLDNRDW